MHIVCCRIKLPDYSFLSATQFSTKRAQGQGEPEECGVYFIPSKPQHERDACACVDCLTVILPIGVKMIHL